MSFVTDRIPLNDVLSLDLDKEKVNPSGLYEMVGVLSYGKGLFNKDEVCGNATSYKIFYKLNEKHIVMSQLFGWEGAIALSNMEFHGKYVSSQFPTFTVDESRLDREFLGWWLKQPKVWAELKSKSKGMGDRRRTLNPNALLTCEIDLPDIDTQRKIVEKISSVARKVNQLISLRGSVSENFKQLLISMARRPDLNESEKIEAGWKYISLSNILEKYVEAITVQPDKEYKHFGIYSFSKGLFRKSPLIGETIKATKLYKTKRDLFIYGRLNAYEGAFGCITDEYDGGYVSNEFPMFECNPELVLPQFLVAYFSSPFVWENLKRKVTGIGGGAGNRRIRLKEIDLLSEHIWLPPLDWQFKIKELVQTRQDDQIQLLAADKQVEALMPSILDKAFKGELV